MLSEAFWNVCRKKEHVYGKLAPQAVNSTLLAEDGEADFATSDKKHPSDFALWKSSKPGEPAWESPACAGNPNGKGRPGVPACSLSPLSLCVYECVCVWAPLFPAILECLHSHGPSPQTDARPAHGVITPWEASALGVEWLTGTAWRCC